MQGNKHSQSSSNARVRVPVEKKGIERSHCKCPRDNIGRVSIQKGAQGNSKGYLNECKSGGQQQRRGNVPIVPGPEEGVCEHSVETYPDIFGTGMRLDGINAFHLRLYLGVRFSLHLSEIENPLETCFSRMFLMIDDCGVWSALKGRIRG